MEESNSSNDYKLSSYNSAGNTIKRIDSLWMSIHRSVASGDYLRWNILLDRLWLEVAGDLKFDADERKKMNEINSKLIKLQPLNSGMPSGFNKKPLGFFDLLSKQYLVLREKEELIKFIENKLGLGKAYVDEMEDDWD